MYCRAITNKNTSCKRFTKIGDYCRQHHNFENPKNKVNLPNDAIYFYDPNKGHGYCSTFTPHPIIIDDIKYQTVHHYYQSQKFTNKDYVELIKNSYSPKIAKILGSQEIEEEPKWRKDLNPFIKKSIYDKIKIREDWETVKLDIMYKALYAKFIQYQDLKEKLLSTGDLMLIENSPKDSYWGIGKNKDGQNHLGKLLMKLRDEIKNDNVEIKK